MPELYPEDQEKVDAFLSTKINAVERASFKPLRLLLVIGTLLGLITLVSYYVAIKHGVI